MLPARLLAELKQDSSEWPDSWTAFCAANPPAANAGSEKHETSDFLLSVAARPNGGDAGRCTTQNAWAALRLLAVVIQRSSDAQELIREELGGLDREGFHSLVTEMAFFKKVASQDFALTVRQLLEDRIIKRHLWVAHRKFRYQGDYTFLIEVDNGLVRLRSMAGPVYTNPRLGPAIRFLQDLHLIDDEGLTDAGQKLMASA